MTKISIMAWTIMKSDFIICREVERSLNMSSFKNMIIAVSIVFILSAYVPSAKAADVNDSNWPTRVTFAQPIQIGDMRLDAGTYEFQLTPGTTARNVVMVYNVDQRHWEGMVMGINDTRIDVNSRNGFTFIRKGTNNPEELEYWFYPGWSRGVKFCYPKSRAAGNMAAVVTPIAQ
jgi:hypothetical protein